MNPLVSILIPAYNAEAWIAETIHSALNQTWPNLEIIIVNDGSSDNTLKIAQGFQSRSVKVINQRNQGAAAARNRAYSESSGEFIQYLDADDLLSPAKVEIQVGKLLEAGTQYVAYGEWVRFINSPNNPEFDVAPNWGDVLPLDWLIDAWENQKMIHPGSWLVPRMITEETGLWNESLSLNDDGEFFCRIVLASQGLKFCKGAFSYYRTFKHKQKSNLSSTHSRSGIESALRSLELCMEEILKTESSDRTRSACAAGFQSIIYTFYPDYSEILAKAEERVRALGGSKLKPFAGHRYQLLCKLVGWKMAKRIKNLIQTY
ncbi:MAG: glycosyltransferase family 2 protein [Anaerolineae bacterium]|nr:glycosyltransferase family 2 protein [Gloeobacterales cyanobacterium ES-bin-313]